MQLNEMVLDNLTKIWNWNSNNKPTDFRTQNGKEWLLLNVYSLANRLKETPDHILFALNELKLKKALDVLRQDSRVLFSLSAEPVSVKPAGITVEQAIEMSKKWDNHIPFGGGFPCITPTVAPYGNSSDPSPYYFKNGERLFNNSCVVPDQHKGWLTPAEVNTIDAERRAFWAEYVPSYDTEGSECF